MPGHNSFTTLRFPYIPDRTAFISSVKEIIENAESGSAFGEEENLEEYDVILVSAIPDLPFTSISYTQKHVHGNDFPLINVGKMEAPRQISSIKGGSRWRVLEEKLRPIL